MEPKEKPSSKCGDVLNKGSSFLSIVSLLLTVSLFLRMESINRKAEMNELRISKVESRVETYSLQTTDRKNEMDSLESKYIALCHLYILQDSNREVFSNCTLVYGRTSQPLILLFLNEKAGDTSSPS